MSYALLRQLRRVSNKHSLNRLETTMTNMTHEDLIFRPSVANWSKVLREAEKIVGYPTSFMNLRWLLSDEFANMALYLRKVVGTNHPVLQTAKSIIYNEQNNLQPWGLVILLLSNAIKNNKSTFDNTVAENQRMLAELTEIIRTGHYVHRGLINTTLEERQQNMDTAMFGNKLAILIGDYLLVTANGMLARLKNQDLSFLISTALRDISEGEFYGPRDIQNIPLPGKRQEVDVVDEYYITCDTSPLECDNTLGRPIREWTVRTLFNGGRLFGRGCQGAVALNGNSETDQEKAFLLGCHLCLAWQAISEIQKVTSKKKDTFSVVSAPVLFALNSRPDLHRFIDDCENDIRNLRYEDLREEVLKTDAIEKTRVLYDNNVEKANNLAKYFGDNQSIDTIKTLIKSF